MLHYTRLYRLARGNTLAYLALSQVTKKMECCEYSPCDLSMSQFCQRNVIPKISLYDWNLIAGMKIGQGYSLKEVTYQ